MTNAIRSSIVAAILWSGLEMAHFGWSRVTAPAGHGEVKERGRIVLSQPLSKLDGDHLKAVLVEVNYGPGEASQAHSHPCPVIGYVVEGAIRSQVKGEPEMTYKAGESFYEPANGVHQVSANASATEPAKLLAYFVCDRDVALSVDVPRGEKPGGSSR
jgi:quercetin dioxygenase-like cupin family protein